MAFHALEAGLLEVRKPDCAQEGLANVCLVGSSMTVVKAKVEGSIPKKRGAAAAGYDKALERFMDKARRGLMIQKQAHVCHF